MGGGRIVNLFFNKKGVKMKKILGTLLCASFLFGYDASDLPWAKKACKQGNAEGCHALGFLYEKGLGVEQNYQKAVEYYKKACNKNNAIACASLGFAYNAGSGVRQNYFEAFKYFKKSCDLKHALGCAGIGRLYITGEGVRQDKYMAKEYFGKACDLGEQEWGCDKYRALNR